MNQVSDFASQLGQSTLLQLHMCRRALDSLGASIAAAHVDAAIQSVRNELGPDGARGQMTAYTYEFFDDVERKLDELLETAGRDSSSLSED